MMYGFGGMGLAGSLLMLMFWVAVILLIVWAVRRYASPPRGRAHDSPLAILTRRYAAGEISQSEYEQAHRILESGGV